MSHLGFCLEIAWKSSEEDLRLGVFVMETSWPTPSLCDLRLLSQVKGVQAAWTGFGLRWSGGHDVFGDIPACSLMGGAPNQWFFFAFVVSRTTLTMRWLPSATVSVRQTRTERRHLTNGA